MKHNGEGSNQACRFPQPKVSHDVQPNVLVYALKMSFSMKSVTWRIISTVRMFTILYESYTSTPAIMDLKRGDKRVNP